GPLSFAIPSAVRGYALAVERFGRTPWRELVAPAVALARAGLPVDWYVTLKTANAAEDLRRYDESRRVWLPDNLPPVCPSSGEPPALILGRLADTLARLAEAGPDDFYQGEIAQAIAADSAAAGGVLSAADLAECRARIVPSLEIAYRSYALQGARPLRGRRLRRPAHSRVRRADGELHHRFCDDPGRGGAPAAYRCERRYRHRDRPPPRQGDPRAARHQARRATRRAHGMAATLCLPEPRHAGRGRAQLRHQRCHVAVVRRSRRTRQGSVVALTSHACG